MNYREVEAINQSLLGDLSDHPKYVFGGVEKYSKDGIALILGSAVDVLLTNKDEFDKLYYKYEVKEPSGKLKEFCDVLFEGCNTFEETKETLSLERAYENCTYSISMERVLDKYEKEGTEYVRALFESKDKQVLSVEQYNLVHTITNNLLTNEFTRKWITSEDDNIEIKYQFPIYWKYGTEKGITVDCKCLLDVLMIDHNNKVIYPIDIKTTGGNVMDFPVSLLKFKYYLQASFYTFAVNKFKETDKKLSDYTVSNFRFVVESTTSPGTPLVFPVSMNTYLLGLDGGEYYEGGKPYRGFKSLIEDYMWHKETQLFKYPREVYENNGQVSI